MSNIEEANKFKALGNTAFSAQNYQEAIQHFTKAIELNPNDHVFFSNRSASYANLEKYEEALEDANKCVQLKPDWAKGYTRKGLAEFYLDKYDDAEATYKKGLELEPTNAQLKEGLERVQEVKEGGAGGAGGFGGNFMANAMGKLLTNPETAGYFQDPEFVQKLTAIQKNPQMISLYMNDPKISKAFQVILSDFTGGAGGFGGAPGAGAGFGGGAPNFEEAKAETMETEEPKFKPQPTKTEAPKPKTSTTASVTPAEAEKNKGNDEYKKKNFDQAIVHYQKAIELDASEPIYYNNLAAVYLEKKEYEKALEACNQAEGICKTEGGHYDYVKYAKILARKAAIYSHQGNYEQSLEYYNKSLLENNDYKVKEEMKKIEKLKKTAEEKAYQNPELAEQHRLKGNELYSAGQYPQAIKEYDEAIKRNPTDAKLYANRGTALMKLMEYPTALRDIDKCLEIDPAYVKAYAKKGVIHFFMKEYHKALEAYEKGLKVEPNNEECKSGVEKTRAAITGGQGHADETKEEQEARLKRAMNDPEIRAIMQDPLFMQRLRDLQERPSDPSTMAMLRDPEVAQKIDKLIAAGIIRMG